MKKDQYIPHEVSTRTCSQVINLIETEGCAGYGIYWALLEYLRVQENYIGDLHCSLLCLRQNPRLPIIRSPHLNLIWALSLIVTASPL